VDLVDLKDQVVQADPKRLVIPEIQVNLGAQGAQVALEGLVDKGVLEGLEGQHHLEGLGNLVVHLDLEAQGDQEVQVDLEALVDLEVLADLDHLAFPENQ
jgi:hypothetical protein